MRIGVQGPAAKDSEFLAKPSNGLLEDFFAIVLAVFQGFACRLHFLQPDVGKIVYQLAPTLKGPGREPRSTFLLVFSGFPNHGNASLADSWIHRSQGNPRSLKRSIGICPCVV